MKIQPGGNTDAAKTPITSKRVVTVSFLVDLLDVFLNFFVAVVTGSVIMLTQVLEGLADLVSSGFLLVGLFRSSHSEDKMHPFGYGKEIYFWTLISALVMFGITSTLSILFGWDRFIRPKHIANLNLAFFVLALTFFTNGYAFWLSWRRLLKKRDFSQIIKIFYRSSLVETKVTFILDLMGTLASLLGMVALSLYAITGDFRFDGLGAIVIGIVLAIFAYLLILGIRDLMIGRSASAELETKIRQAALTVEEVRGVLDLKTLYIGSDKLLVNLDVHMQSRLTTRELEKLIDKIKEKIQEVVPSVKYLQVELETPEK